MPRLIKISIIIPNYNHEKYLAKRLDSIFNQTYTDYEVILLDDASTDNSVEVLESYANRDQVSHFIVNTNNSGSPFLQWKKGIDLAKGEYIWIAESDDLAEKTLLEKAMSIMENDKTSLVYNDSRLIDGQDRIGDYTFNQIELSKLDKQRWKSSYKADGLSELTQFFVHQTTIPNASAVVFKKELVDQVPWSLINTMNLVGDKLFWASCLAQCQISYNSEPLNFHRHHEHTQRARTNFQTWYFENLCYLHHLSQKVKSDEISKHFEYFKNHFASKIIDYSLNVFSLFPHLKKVWVHNKMLFLKLVLLIFPKHVVYTLVKRIFLAKKI